MERLPLSNFWLKHQNIFIYCCRNKKSPNNMGIKTNNHENLYKSISSTKLRKLNTFKDHQWC